MNLTKEMKAKKKRVRLDRGLRQDRGTRAQRRGEPHNREAWQMSAIHRRAVRHGGDEPLEIVEEEEVSPWDL